MSTLRATLLGHASLLVEAAGSAVLMDPVFFDPFERGMVSNPPRTVHRESFPRIDAVVLSHGHSDHFDPPSLLSLDKKTLIVCPHEPTLVMHLKDLGFTQVRPIAAFERLRIGALEIMPTAAVEDDEFGVVFRAGDLSLWNQVDTATTQAMSVRVLDALSGRLDAAITPYCPLQEHAEIWTEERAFPRERYERLLEAAVCTRARTIVPGSCGQAHAGDAAWQSALVFQVAPEQFLRDLQRLAPEIQTLDWLPGEALCLRQGAEATLEKTRYASAEPRLHFAPSATPKLVDANAPGVAAEELEEAVRIIMEQALPEAWRRSLTYRAQGPLRTLWDRRATMAIEVVFPTGDLSSWHHRDWRAESSWVEGPLPDADYTFSYRASELHAALMGERGFQGEFRARRSATVTDGRLLTLDPYRLHGIDPYYVVDHDPGWHPLGLVWPSRRVRTR